MFTRLFREGLGRSGAVDGLVVPGSCRTTLSLRRARVTVGGVGSFFLDDVSARLQLQHIATPLFMLGKLNVGSGLDKIRHPIAFPVGSVGRTRTRIIRSLTG